MTTLFIVEKSKKAALGAAAALMGDYAVRVFGSLTSLKHLVKVPGQAVPDIILADVDDIGETVSFIADFLRGVLPQAALIMMHLRDLSHDELSMGNDCGNLTYLFRKPFDSLALSKFVANISRSHGKKSNVLRIRDFVFDFDRLSCRILQDDHVITLPLKEAQILKLMIERHGEYLRRADIQKILWPNIKVSPRTIDSHISRLRKRLSLMQVTISNKYGDGYLLKVN